MKKPFFLAVMLLCSMSLFAQEQKQEEMNRGYIVSAGDTAPDFQITYLDGTVKQLSDLQGKVVMLQFTASWCGVCRKEMPHIESDIWQKYKDNPEFALIGIDLKEDKETIERFIAKTGISYPLVFDSDGAIFEKYAEKNAGVTRNIIIDRSGKIVFLTRLYDEKEFGAMKEKIEKLLNNR